MARLLQACRAAGAGRPAAMAPQQHSAQQHGSQQQTQTVSCFQLP